MTLTVGSLFSGIGGLDLGLERAGMTVRWQSEIDPYACRVLAKHWPHVPNLGDVRTVDWSTVERVDLICGGYPCQPFSLAGTRAGDTDARHLWPYMLTAIRVLRPRWALLENVPGHLSLGFGRVLGDLAESGYDCEWDCIPAAAVGAPHRRDRVFIVAHTDRVRREGNHRVPSAPVREVRNETLGHVGAVRPMDGTANVADAASNTWWVSDGNRETNVPNSDGERLEERRLPEGQRREDVPDAAWRGGSGETVADAEGIDGAWSVATRDSGGRPEGPIGDSGSSVADSDELAGSSTRTLGVFADATAQGSVNRVDGRCRPDGDYWSVESDVGGVANGIPSRLHGGGLTVESSQRDETVGWWDVEPDVPRVATGVANRVDRLRCLGNAVVPQVAEWIGHRIMEAAS